MLSRGRAQDEDERNEAEDRRLCGTGAVGVVFGCDNHRIKNILTREFNAAEKY